MVNEEKLDICTSSQARAHRENMSERERERERENKYELQGPPGHFNEIHYFTRLR